MGTNDPDQACRASRIITDEFIAAWPFPSLGRIATAEEQAWPLMLLNSPLNGAISPAFIGG
jgi:hypothetical protein